jgi:hypothetical protein
MRWRIGISTGDYSNDFAALDAAPDQRTILAGQPPMPGLKSCPRPTADDDAFAGNEIGKTFGQLMRESKLEINSGRNRKKKRRQN